MTHYLPAWIASYGTSGGWTWGEPCRSPSEAARIVKQRIADGTATMGCVVCDEDGVRTPLGTYVWPTAARKVVRHWEELLDETDKGD